MAAVLIDSGPIEATDRLRDVPQDKWHDLMRKRKYYLDRHLSYDCRCLVEFVNDAEMMHQVCGFASPEAMIREGYELEPAEIAVAVEWLRLNPPVDPVSLKIAVDLGRQGAPPGNKNAVKNKVDNINIVSKPRTKGGTDPAYLLARLDRDEHHELAAEVRAGTISANAAATLVDYRKPPSPLEQLRKAWKKASAEERAEFLAEIQGQNDGLPRRPVDG